MLIVSKKKIHFDCTKLKAICWRTMGPTRRGAGKCVPCRRKNGEKEDESELEEENNSDECRNEEEKKNEKDLRDKVMNQLGDPNAKQLMMLFDQRFNEFEKAMSKIMSDSETE